MRALLAAKWGQPLPESIDDPLLTRQERARCDTFHHEIDAARHATGHLMARRMAARWLHLPPEEVLIRADEAPTRGRPRFVLASAPPPRLHLSIAHAGDVVLVAVGDLSCGVDVEVVSAVAPLIGTPGVFTATEERLLREMAPADRAPAAAHWWTVKEAALKAIGRGLVEPLDTLEASGAVVDTVAHGYLTQWVCTTLPMPPGHTATIATPAEVEVRIHLPGGHRCLRGEDQWSYPGW